MQDLNQFFGREIRKRSQDWARIREALVPALPPDYLQQVVYAVVEDNRMTMFASSAAWTAKLRFYDREIVKVLRDQGHRLRSVQVRTAPGTAGRR